MRGLSIVATSGGHSSSRCTGLSLLRPLLLRSTGSRRAGSVVVAHGPSCSAACGIFADQGSNPCPLHWQVDSQPLCHQGSPRPFFLNCNFYLDLSLNIHSVESQLPCWEDISNLLERSTWWGAEVSCQQPAQTCQPCAQAIWEHGPPASSKPSDNHSPSWHFDFNLMRELQHPR